MSYQLIERRCGEGVIDQISQVNEGAFLGVHPCTRCSADDTTFLVAAKACKLPCDTDKTVKFAVVVGDLEGCHAQSADSLDPCPWLH